MKENLSPNSSKGSVGFKERKRGPASDTRTLVRTWRRKSNSRKKWCYVHHWDSEMLTNTFGAKLG